MGQRDKVEGKGEVWLKFVGIIRRFQFVVKNWVFKNSYLYIDFFFFGYMMFYLILGIEFFLRGCQVFFDFIQIIRIFDMFVFIVIYFECIFGSLVLKYIF